MYIRLKQTVTTIIPYLFAVHTFHTYSLYPIKNQPSTEYDIPNITNLYIYSSKFIVLEYVTCIRFVFLGTEEVALFFLQITIIQYVYTVYAFHPLHGISLFLLYLYSLLSSECLDRVSHKNFFKERQEILPYVVSRKIT